MPQDLSIPLRKTQRAPRSCIPCSSRKIKCDKSIPCGSCIRRGQPDTCIRELVIVRGEVTAYQHNAQLPTYEDLKQENERLRAKLDSLQARQAALHAHQEVPTSGTDRDSNDSSRYLHSTRKFEGDQDGLERRLWTTLASEPFLEHSQVTTWDDIIMPSKQCSELLVSYDEEWNSWVHYALEYPIFRHECDSFISATADGAALKDIDPSWLAVYFSVLTAALLMMDDDAAKALPVHETTAHQDLSWNWYSSSIFCLHQAQFMRIPSVRSVQAIAVLGICCNNFGDSEFGSHLWVCAIRIAKKIGLNSPVSEVAGEHLSAEAQHRLWWTLVICEWLGQSYRAPVIDESDFDVPYPQAPELALSNSSGQQENPVHYHVFMARASKVYYRFRRAIQSHLNSTESMIKHVRLADEELASIIETLPVHLQPDTEIVRYGKDLHHGNSSEGWVKWQRFDLTLVLLHLRIRINRTLQVHWLSTSSHTNIDCARTISVRSAISIIWIHKNWDQPFSMRKQWAISYHIFIAALVLLREWQDDDSGRQTEYYDGVCSALDQLDQVRLRNAVAHHAFSVLQEGMTQAGFS